MQIHGIAYDRRDSISYRDQFEKRNREYYLKQEEISRLNSEIEKISLIHFKDRTDAQDQYLNELYTQLSAITGVA